MKRWLGEFWRYARHVVALFVPNAGAPAQVADRNKPGDVSGWGSDDLDALIEEGRRQLDRHHDDLERIRARSQILLALGLALVGTVAALDDRVSSSGSDVARILWAAALVTGAWSILGAAATSVVKAVVEVIDSTTLSNYRTPIKRRLASDYAEIVIAGENQLATRLTNLRHAVMWLLIAAILALFTWIKSPEPDQPVGWEPACCHQVSPTSYRVDRSGGRRSARIATIDRSSVIPNASSILLADRPARTPPVAVKHPRGVSYAS
jgi:hypothetical protein